MGQKPPTEVLYSGHFETRTKTFDCSLNRNERGLVVKLTEQVSGRRNTVLIPAECLASLGEILNEINRKIETLPK